MRSYVMGKLALFTGFTDSGYEAVMALFQDAFSRVQGKYLAPH